MSVVSGTPIETVHNGTSAYDHIKHRAANGVKTPACQRLIDYGRTEYIRKHLFHRSSAEQDYTAADVSLCHYCSSDVTPQNALIVAKKG